MPRETRMNEPLRPSTLGEILDRTVQLYRSRFLLFLGISVIPTGVIVVLACIVGLVVAWWVAVGAGSVSEEIGYVLVAVFAIGVALVALPILLAATALAMAAMSHAVSCVHLGQTTTIRDAYKSVWHGADGAISDSICCRFSLSEPLRLPFGLC